MSEPWTADQARAAKILKGILEVHAKTIGFSLTDICKADIIDYYAEEFAEIRAEVLEELALEIKELRSKLPNNKPMQERSQ
jgi:hypothetical protein